MSSQLRLTHILEKWGGLELILSPEFTPPDALFEELDRAGYRVWFEKGRREKTLPEREQALIQIARTIYSWWYYRTRHIPRDLLLKLAPCAENGIRWQDDSVTLHLTVHEVWNVNSNIMDKYAITQEEVEKLIWSDPVEFPPLVSDDSNGNSEQTAGVPRQPLSPIKESEIALPLPESEDSNET